MTTTADETAERATTEPASREPLPDWFEDHEVQQRMARLIARAAVPAPDGRDPR